MARELVARGVAVHQHGFAHVNHEPEGRKHEFGPSRSREEQRRDIEAGRELLSERLDGARRADLHAAVESLHARDRRSASPSWASRCCHASRAPSRSGAVLRELPVSLDFVRLSPDELARRFVAAAPPVGVMFHHAEMDDAAMDRAGELLALLAGHARVVARPMMALV